MNVRDLDEARDEIRKRIHMPDLLRALGADLKKAGSGFTMHCWWHNENTGSFRVYVDHGHCFGCGESVDIFDAWQARNGGGHMDALRALAEQASVHLPQPTPEAQARYERQRRTQDLFGLVARTAQERLWQGDAAANLALQVLRNRGLSDATLREARIGLAPDWDLAKRALIREGDGGIDAGLACGLLKRRSDGRGTYDALHHCFIFPVHRRGRVATIFGRPVPGLLNDDARAKTQVLGLPSEAVPDAPEAPKFFWAGRRSSKRVVIVEGEIDALTVAQCGFSAVGLRGAEAAKSVAELLDEIPRGAEVLVIPDADVRGRAATRDLALVFAERLRVCPLLAHHQGCKDPNDVLKALLAEEKGDIDKATGRLQTELEETAEQSIAWCSWEVRQIVDGSKDADRMVTAVLANVIPVLAKYDDHARMQAHVDDVCKATKLKRRPITAKLKELQREERRAREEQRAADREARGGEDESQAPTIANFTARVEIVHTGDEAKEKVVKYQVALNDIVANMHRLTGDWPRSVNGVLFACAPVPVGIIPTKRDVRTFESADALFAWLNRGWKVEWTKAEVEDPERSVGTRNPVTAQQFFHATEANAKYAYASVELLPHHPPRADAYYACGAFPDGDGSALRAFVAMFNPATAKDRQLMMACLMTPAWGGDPGKRPAFVFASDHGPGSGKTYTAEGIAQVYRGRISISPRAEWERVLDRLLSDNALSKRIVLIDNVKGKLSSEQFESAITAPVIDGRRMFHGDFERPNNLTWLLSANVPELSRDLASRAVIIKVGPKIKGGQDFLTAVAAFLRERHYELLCDIMARLRRGPVVDVSRLPSARFPEWHREVLGTFENAKDLVDLIAERQPTVDADAAEAKVVADAMEEMLRARNWDPDTESVHFKHAVMLEKFASMFGTKSDKAFGLRMRELLQSAPLSHVTFRQQRPFGRGYLWQKATKRDKIYDLERMQMPVDDPGDESDAPDAPLLRTSGENRKNGSGSAKRADRPEGDNRGSSGASEAPDSPNGQKPSMFSKLGRSHGGDTPAPPAAPPPEPVAEGGEWEEL